MIRGSFDEFIPRSTVTIHRFSTEPHSERLICESACLHFISNQPFASIYGTRGVDILSITNIASLPR